jgi:hypothetical protein|tara:strand:- start:2686 stop:2946 length:261 start_codon:yes stop_codon:yes gene_type:complete
MTKLIKIVGKKKSSKFLDKTNPDVICDYLAEMHPELPDSIIEAMALAMIYSTYLSMVCDEEDYSCQKLFDQELPDFLLPHGQKTIH